MNSSSSILAAAAVSLLLNAANASAQQKQFSTPTTEQAQKSAELLRRTADGFYKLPLVVGGRTSGQPISDLWLFPTGDPHTVFARYTVGANDGSPNQHLSVLSVRDDRIIAVRELTDAHSKAAREQPRTGDALHWSATIGTGHAVDTSGARYSVGSPASSDWTSSIGTGRAAQSASAPQATSAMTSVNTASAAQAHWTSKIGTGRAAGPELSSTSTQAVTIAALSGVTR